MRVSLFISQVNKISVSGQWASVSKNIMMLLTHRTVFVETKSIKNIKQQRRTQVHYNNSVRTSEISYDQSY